MEITEQVTKWVEKKIGKIISKEIEDQVQDKDSSFDVSAYVNDLLERFFKENEVESIKQVIDDDNFRDRLKDNFESDYSTESDNYSYDLLEFESNLFNYLSSEAIVANLHNNPQEVDVEYLQVLEASAEDLINLKSWGETKKILQNLLKTKSDRKIHILILKIFQKFLMSYSKPQLVCEGFISLTEVISLHIESINSVYDFISYEEVYDFKENKWLAKNKSNEQAGLSNRQVLKNPTNIEVLIKSMWLIIECQKQMPEKWIRFNERRLREIIFSFIHLLASTTQPENEKLSGLELVSILNPTATWCRHWCHTAVGSSLLCSALRKYKNFFVHVVENILSNISHEREHHSHTISENIYTVSPRTGNDLAKLLTSKEGFSQAAEKENINDKKHLDNERQNCIRSAPNMSMKTSSVKSKSKVNSNWFIENIPQNVVTQAKFCHCMCLVVCLIQFQNGRSLFPIQTRRKRMLTVRELVLSMIHYLENIESIQSTKNEVHYTLEYKQHVSQLLDSLKNVDSEIHSFRKSADRLPLSQR